MFDAPAEDGRRPLKITIHAIGGQGGGVLSDWIVELAQANGYLAQSTSVPGVAQRTGQTVYYVEVFPRALAEAAGAEPVLALMPNQGDVDLVLAAELMEAGRAVTRGFVTPRTVVIASSHRVYGIGEKSAMGDGRGDSARVLEAVAARAQRLVAFDMAEAAESAGSVISAVMFGALAGAEVLPFARSAFEDTIRHGGVGVDASLRAFAAGFDGARAGAAPRLDRERPAQAAPEAATAAGRALLAEILDRFPAALHEILWEGVKRLADYQDRAYAATYLRRLEAIRQVDDGADDFRLTGTAARYLALWMSYEDVIRVADLKTRASRAVRVREEVRVKPDQLLNVSEFMHPRLQEVCDTLPADLGAWVLRTPWLRKALEPLFRDGRRVQTARLRGFLLLYALAALRPMRRSTLRFRAEDAEIEAWLARVRAMAPLDHALAVELAECPRLVKGYGDTHARGMRSYRRILEALDAAPGRLDAAQVRRMREAALKDEAGTALSRELDQLRA